MFHISLSALILGGILLLLIGIFILSLLAARFMETD